MKKLIKPPKTRFITPTKKVGRPKKRHPGGRPVKMTHEVLEKLLSAFSFGMTDVQACLYAEIDPTTLYKYCRKNERFAHRKEELKQMPVIHAKKNVVSSIMKGDVENSKWLLDRRDPDFKNRSHIDVANVTDPITLLTAEQRLAIENALKAQGITAQLPLPPS